MKRGDLPFSGYSRSIGQNSGPNFGFRGSLGAPPPKGEKTCPGSIYSVSQNTPPFYFLNNSVKN